MIVYTQPREAPQSISTDARLEMGGFGTMRGFHEASIGELDIRERRSGIDLFLFNLELRIPVYKNIFATLFADIGNLVMDYPDIFLKRPHLGVGFGLGYVTPIGAVRFDYARAIEEMDPNYRGVIYLNFANPF